MKPSENTHGTSVVQVSERHVSFSDQVNDDQSSQSNVPLLLQPSYARSKSSIYDELRNFRISLKWCALDHSSTLGKFISYLTFLLLTVMVPIISSTSIKLPDTFPEENPISMNKVVQLPESGLAAIGFFTLARFFMRYGLRQLLFLDGLREDSQYVRRGYARELEKAFRYLACILLPSFFVEFTHKVLLFSTVTVSSSSSSSIIILPPYIVGSAEIPLAKAAVFVMVLGSWVYRTGVFLLVCVLFRLTCELQILRLEGLRKIFEEGCSADADVIFREHVRIRQQLSVTSHRYRFFIIGCLVTITLSQLGELILVVASKSEKNFFTSGDLVVCSGVQLSGFFLCLMGAAKITHRAQGIVCVATRWNMLVTSASAASGETDPINAHAPNSSSSGNSSSDSDSSDTRQIGICPQNPYSFQTRQALVTYLEHNNGGITLFGFTLDRGLLHTLFAFEFSLVLWILSKVITLT